MAVAKKKSSGTLPKADAPLVLYVEDAEDIRRLHATYLKKAGLRVVEAETGQEALARAAEQTPDCVVLDLGLPGMDGYEVARKLRAEPATANVPIVMLTAHGFRAHMREASAAGCDEYLVKPTPGPELVRVVIGLLAKRRAESRTSTPS